MVVAMHLLHVRANLRFFHALSTKSKVEALLEDEVRASLQAAEVPAAEAVDPSWSLAAKDDVAASYSELDHVQAGRVHAGDAAVVGAVAADVVMTLDVVAAGALAGDAVGVAAAVVGALA
eukprot:TRINITY_DN3058_c1_g2_i1.p2 TRINITY_DN3058_c1_g2~~TRINITY_DN3058_c1_g2_i1.p2  ORF type:complete len:120 (+),score=34.16 TRINITY_DN3058_c1_g2_i1:167-526(+)